MAMKPHAMFIPPKLQQAQGDTSRRAIWLELFYDLIFAAAISAISDVLSEDVSFSGLFPFLLLYIPVWWAWTGTTFYSDRFDSDDVLHRALVFAQIFVISLVILSIPEGGDGSARFALAYAAVRGLLIIMYLRAYQHVPQSRPLVRRYLIGFSIAALIWLASAFVPPPLRYIMWVVGFVIDFGTPISSMREQGLVPPSRQHLPERYGYFTLIVMGEAFTRVIGSLMGTNLSIGQIIADAPGLAVTGSLWWLYFTNVANAAPRFKWGGPVAPVWLYTHLPLHIGLAALSVGLAEAISQDAGGTIDAPYRWLLCGAVALCLVAIGVLELTMDKHKTADDQDDEDEADIGGEQSQDQNTPRGYPNLNKTGDLRGVMDIDFWLRLASVPYLLLLAAFGSGLNITVFVILVTAPCFLQVLFDIYQHWQVSRRASVAAAT